VSSILSGGRPHTVLRYNSRELKVHALAEGPVLRLGHAASDLIVGLIGWPHLLYSSLMVLAPTV